MNKKGITLLTLSIAIIVMAIITGVVVIHTDSIVDETKLAKFGEELELIEDVAKEYYISNGAFPILDKTEYTMAQLVALNTVGYGTKLQGEIIYNKDEDSIFYLIDVDTINVKLQDRGLETTADDVYVISSNANKVYYVRGVEINNKVYFSTAYIANTTIIE